MATILVVDDHAPTRKPLVRLLEMSGYTAVAASDAFEAMTYAKKLRPDLILLDVMIPPMDGLTVLMLLHEDGVSNIPVILVTGLSDAQTHQRAEALGVNEYLVKSQFTPDELMSLVRKYVPAEPDPTVAETIPPA